MCIMLKRSFRYGFVAGKQLRYAIDINGSIDVATPMGNMSNPIGIVMHISQTVVSCDDTQATIKVCIDRVTADSSIPADKLPKTGVESLMHMDALGTVRWVNGEAAWQGAEHSMMRFPEEALQVGDSWVQAVEDVSGSATAFHTRYRFKGLDKRNESIAVFTSELFSAHPDAPGSQMIGRGVFTFDFSENWIHGCNNHLKYEYRMPVPENPAMHFVTTTVLDIDMERL